MITRLDGFNGQQTDAAVDMSFWCTDAVIVGDWVAFYDSDTTNPGGYTGFSCRLGDDSNADAKFGTFGFAVEASSAASYGKFRVRGRGSANVDSGASVAIGDDLTIGTTAGRAIEFTGTDPQLRLIARCESTPSSNLATVELYVHPRLVGLLG